MPWTALVTLALGQGAASWNVPADFVIQRSGSRYALSLGRDAAFRQTTGKVSDTRSWRIPGTAGQVATWVETIGRTSTPYYAITLDGEEVVVSKPADLKITIRYKNFTPGAESEPTVTKQLDADEDSTSYIVQFHTQSLDEYQTALKNAGAKIIRYVPNQAYVVQMSAESKAVVEKLPFVRWIGHYEPAYKLDPAVLKDFNSGTLAKRHYVLQMNDWGPAQKAIVAQRLAIIGAPVLANIPEGYILEAELTPSQMIAVSHWDEVFYLEYKGVPSDDMNLARQIGGADVMDTVQGYNGQGVRAEVMDGNFLSTHLDYVPAPIIHRAGSGSQTHGSSTYGIVFGDGVTDGTAKGMLPGAQGIFASYISLPNRYTHTAELVSSPYFGVFQSNSWGDTQVLNYTSISQQMDDIIRINDIAIFQSQSNTGTRNSRPQAWAKNIISIGGISHQNTLVKTDDAWTSASVGPAEDGRLKPDICHFYDNIRTTTSGINTAYTITFGGTSGATPICAGYGGLLFQMWSDGIFGNINPAAIGSTNAVFENRPKAMTIKAMMINTASPYNIAGTTSRVQQGWGMPDANNWFNSQSKMFVQNEGVNLTNLQTKTYKLYVPAGEPQFKVTMCYMDVPGTTATTQHRINDLTLKVTSPSGTVYWGNNGLTAANWSTSGGAADTLNTVENVWIQNPSAGTWTVEVIASQINADGVTETVGNDADFSLVASGVVANIPPASLRIDSGSVESPSLHKNAYTSNNTLLNIAPTTPTAPSVKIRAFATVPVVNWSKIRVVVESKTTVPAATLVVRLFNYQTGQVDDIGTTTVGTGETVFTAQTAGAGSPYVAADGTVQAFVEWQRASRVGSVTVNLDAIRFQFDAP